MKKRSESSQPEKLVRVNGDDIMSKPLSEEWRRELAALAAKPDSDIDFSDAPEVVDLTHWKPVKVPISLRIDGDVLAWLKKSPGYQRRINEILRQAMNAKP